MVVGLFFTSFHESDVIGALPGPSNPAVWLSVPGKVPRRQRICCLHQPPGRHQSIKPIPVGGSSRYRYSHGDIAVTKGGSTTHAFTYTHTHTHHAASAPALRTTTVHLHAHNSASRPVVLSLFKQGVVYVSATSVASQTP